MKPLQRNQDGYLDRGKLEAILGMTEETVSTIEIDELMRDGDKNNDGRIDFDEFLKMMENVPV
uniref:EF-hand domain-containing protein n=1 Tax=Eptatretus burgeri TaxID=7764 RepID=A0A8C4Q751_EPTBU